MAVSNPTCYWKLDEASGTRVESAKTPGFDLTDNNGVTNETGVIGSAASFDPTGAGPEFPYLSCAHDETFWPAASFAWQVWAKITGLGGDQWLVGKWESGGGYEYAIFYSSGSGTFEFWVRESGGSFKSVVADVEVEAGVWYCIHAWRDDATGTINIAVNDGTPQSTSAGTLNQGTAPLILGANEGGTDNFLYGAIDEVAYWANHQMPSGQRTELYNGGAGLSFPFTTEPDWDEDPTTDLTSNWHLNESGSTQRYDAISNNHLTASGSTIGSTTGLGGTDAMSLTRANQDHAGRASTPSLQTGDVPFTFITAVKLNTLSGSHLIASKDNTGSVREWNILWSGGNSRFAASVYRPTAVTVTANSYVSSHGAIATGTWYVVALWHNPTSDEIGIFVSDGTNHATDTQATGGALQAPGAAEFRLGSSQSVPTSSLDGVIEESLWYRRVVSVADLERIAELIINEDIADWPWYQEPQPITADPDPVTATWSVPAVSTSKSLSPAALSSTWTVPEVATAKQTGVSPVASTWSVPTTKGGKSDSPAPLTLTWTALAPSTSKKITPDPAGATWNVPPLSLAQPAVLTWSVVTPNVARSTSPAPVGASWAVGTPYLTVPVVASWSVPQPSTSKRISVSPVRATWSVPQPQTSKSITPDAPAGTWSAVTPETAKVLAVDPVELEIAAPTPATTKARTPAALSVSWTVPAAIPHKSITPDAAAATWSVVAPSFTRTVRPAPLVVQVDAVTPGTSKSVAVSPVAAEWSVPAATPHKSTVVDPERVTWAAVSPTTSKAVRPEALVARWIVARLKTSIPGPIYPVRLGTFLPGPVSQDAFAPGPRKVATFTPGPVAQDVAQ